MLRGVLRPWSQTMVSEGARPWGGGRSGDCEEPQEIKTSEAKNYPKRFLGVSSAPNSVSSVQTTR